MKNFEFKRFGRVLSRDIQENRTKNLRAFFSLYVANLAIIGFNFYTPSRYGLPDMDKALGESLLLGKTNGVITMFFFFLFYFVLSQTFSNFRTKQLRISNLMLPATNLEKYLSRVVQSTFVYAVAFCVAFVLADLTRMMLFPLWGHSFGSLVPNMWQGVCDLFSYWCYADFGRSLGGTTVGWFVVFGIAFYLWSFSCYLLGGAFFRKRAFLYTILLLVGSGILLGLAVDFGRNTLGIHFVIVKGTAMPLLACLFGVLTCLNVWLSYRLFKRMQVIPRKILRK